LNEVLKKHQPTNFFITPTLVRVLSAYQSHINCDPLKFVAIGGGYLSKNCFVKFTRQFTCAYYYKTYGITEAGPRVSTYTIAYDQIHNFQPNYIGAPLENVQLATGKAIGNYQGKVSCYLHINTPSVYTGYLIDHQHCHKKKLGLETRISCTSNSKIIIFSAGKRIFLGLRVRYGVSKSKTYSLTKYRAC